jgi:hypothetical protein
MLEEKKKKKSQIAWASVSCPTSCCVSKCHHLNILEKTYVNMEGYTIAAQFCRVLYEKGGVIIYVHNGLQEDSPRWRKTQISV